jgi:hypothetical protein
MEDSAGDHSTLHFMNALAEIPFLSNPVQISTNKNEIASTEKERKNLL